MYNSQFQLFGSKAYLFGETHIDPRESTVSYELCQRLQPDLICVESPNDKLYPNKSTGHNGLQSYIDKTDVPIVGIDTKPSDKSHGTVSEQIGNISATHKKDTENNNIHEHRSRRMDDPITNIEEREEHMVQNIINAVRHYNPDKVFILVGKMHAESITNALLFIGSL